MGIWGFVAVFLVLIAIYCAMVIWARRQDWNNVTKTRLVSGWIGIVAVLVWGAVSIGFWFYAPWSNF